MSSIIQGYTYDIFISYRQKDNKGESWVSEFVETLKTELESTFKEEISVYFDINPHDGLLETNDVTESLKEKLKCLIFIPIISRTYCDPKSFAWEHEFIPFINAASSDRFGLKTVLPNGNVSGRILPVRIHDIDQEDISLFEKVAGGALRGIDFVYRSTGVNRPLMSHEDHPHDNINKTYYRDQINKVANAVKDIINALKQADAGNEIPAKETHAEESLTAPRRTLSYKILFIPLLLLFIAGFAYFLLKRHPATQEPVEKTIAVLPFEKWFSNKDYSYLGDAIASQINSQLRAVKALYVISFNSTRRYTAPDIPVIRQIGKECGANLIIQGSVELSGDNRNISISIQLLNTKTSNLIWEEKFKGKLDSLQTIRSGIIKSIAQALRLELTPEEIIQIEKGITKSPEAYKNFLSANYQEDAVSLASMGKKYQDSISYELAIAMYDRAIRYDSTFALAYARRAISRSWAYFSGKLTDPETIDKCKKDIDKALKLNHSLAEAHNANGFYYYYFRNDFKKAIDCFNTAAEIDPGNWQPVYYLAIVYRRMGEWKKSQSLLSKVLKYNPHDALILNNIAGSYIFLRNYDSALIFQNLAIRTMPNWTDPYSNKIITICLKNGNTSEARQVVDSATKQTGYKFQNLRILLDTYEGKFNDALINMELSGPEVFTDLGDKFVQFATIHNYLAHPDLAKVYYDSALVFILKKVKEEPGNARNYSRLAFAYAGLKNEKKAIEAAKRAVALTPDDLRKNEFLLDLAKIYVLCGNYHNSLTQIEYLLQKPSVFSVRMLYLDPLWKPLLNQPEFKKFTSYNY